MTIWLEWLFSDDIKDITDLVEELVAEREGKKASK